MVIVADNYIHSPDPSLCLILRFVPLMVRLAMLLPAQAAETSKNPLHSASERIVYHNTHEQRLTRREARGGKSQLLVAR